MKPEAKPQVRREAVATPRDIKTVLAITPQKAAKLKKEQEKNLALFRSRALLSREERRLGRGSELIQHHLQTGNMDALAEAFVMTGQLEEALKVVKRDDLRAEIQAKADAVNLPNENCECPDFREEGNLRIPNQHIESEVMVKGKLVPAVRCAVCKVLNVRPAPVHLLEQRGARKESLSGKEVKATEFFKR